MRTLTLERSRLACFLDLDGTLLDLVDAPAFVRPDPGIRQLIDALTQSLGGAVALITGRSISDIDRILPGSRLSVAGQHGAERRDALGRFVQHGHRSPRLDAVHDSLARDIAAHPGLLLEDKGLSMALHYRRAPQHAGLADSLMRKARSIMGPAYCLQFGKSVVELKPVGKDKGTAIADFMMEPPFRGRTPLFVGDDITDEYGFEVVNRMSGYSVKVGQGATMAEWRLPNTEAVIAWLTHGTRAPSRVLGQSDSAMPPA